jgi:glyoxylase-like metal-dependent hydrolase (beta-lactamase superfamily II)
MPPDLSSSNGQLRSAIGDLYATPSIPLPFLSGVVARSFVLKRGEGNLIIYHSPGLNAARAEILALGEPSRLLLNHWHEALCKAPDFAVPIFVHEDDRAKVKLPVAGVLSKREKIADDLEVIPIPGHTAGATAFLWDNGEQRMLFPGDSVWVSAGEWSAVVLSESNREAYIASLRRILELDFNFLMPWGGGEGQPYGYSVTRDEAQSKLQRMVDRLQAGESG